jgi:ADP-heptose:LPS heptosyltransferase
MDLYRITFHTKGFLQKHYETTVDKAKHFHVLKNNRKFAEQSKLESAIKSIMLDTGENKELQKLIKHIPILQNPDNKYICIGITYGDKYGVKLEMKPTE